MKKLGPIEDTLFIPLVGRIIASEKYPTHIHDEKAISLKDNLFKDPSVEELYKKHLDSEYGTIAAATRSKTMDRLAKHFIDNNKDAVIVQIGCGLETSFYRLDNGKTLWYEVDFQNVIDYRKEIIGESPRDIPIVSDAFSDTWIKDIKERHPDSPILVIASGFLYYFENKKVMELFKTLKAAGNFTIAFDSVNTFGLIGVRKYMKMIGFGDVKIDFKVNNPEKLAKEFKATLKYSENIYESVSRKRLRLLTRFLMFGCDLFNMTKIIKIKF